MVTAKKILSDNEIQYEPGSIVDQSGRVFYWNNRVFREIYDDDVWKRYKGLIESPILQELVDAGLIETWIPDDVELKGCAGLLEHKKIDFVSYVSEWTFYMLWDAAKVYLDLQIILVQNGMAFKDGHPWNILFDYCKPTMVDFGSIVNTGEKTPNWYDEFRIRFIAPLAAYKQQIARRLANELLYEHIHGVGLSLLKNRLGSLFPFQFNILVRKYKKAIQKKDRAAIINAVVNMRSYLDTLQPDVIKEKWANYIQMPDGEASAQKAKTNAVLDMLKEFHPDTVLDMGANKGWYAFLAESQGSRVVAFDYEGYCVDQIYFYGKEKNSRVLPLKMNFLLPTPESGIGLTYKSAYERYRSDATLVLGMTHHLSLHQNLGFSHIARIVKKFTKTATVIEFVHPDDEHIRNWVIPANYSQENFIQAMWKNGFDLVKETRPISTRSILVFRRKQ